MTSASPAKWGACALEARQLRALKVQTLRAQGASHGPRKSHQVELAPNPPTLEPARTAGPLNPIIIRENFLYDAVTRKRFFSKGVAYNPRNIGYEEVQGQKSTNCTGGQPASLGHKKLGYAADVATDSLENEWGLALRAIANLGANTVRLYNINPANNHSKFMRAAEALGLYVIIPLTRKDWGYLPAFPSPDCYEMNITGYGNVGVNVLTSAKLIVKEFSTYSNTLMFTVANELTVNDKNGYSAFPCVKALTRDVHQYQTNCKESMRRVPLIYSDMDMGPPDRVKIGMYLTCELEGPDDAVDAYGLNVYSWCDPSYPDETGEDNFQYSPYSAILQDFKQFNKPLLFTEFGCNTGAFETPCPYTGGRTWPDFKHIVGELGEVVSGAVAFEFSMEDNQYGLALTPGFLKGQKQLYLLDNYYALQKAFTTYNVSNKWDGLDVESCTSDPSEIAPLATTHTSQVCPSKASARQVQEGRRVDKVSDWHTLPAQPTAHLSDVDGQSECPTEFRPSEVDMRETCCHTTC